MARTGMIIQLNGETEDLGAYSFFGAFLCSGVTDYTCRNRNETWVNRLNALPGTPDLKYHEEEGLPYYGRWFDTEGEY